MKAKYDLFLFCGEPSGDLHGAALLKELYNHNPNLKVLAVAGPKMRALGVDCFMKMENFQVMGLYDLIFTYIKIYLLGLIIEKKILSIHPTATIFIDYSSFSLVVENDLRMKGYTGKLIHFISPTVWHRAESRIKQMEKNLDKLLCILPYEPSYFSSSFNVSYVGNPVFSYIRKHVYQPIEDLYDKKIISFFPGSRPKIILRNFPIYCKFIASWMKKHPDFHFAISVTDEKFTNWMKKQLKKEGTYLVGRVHFIPSNRNYDLMRISHLAIAKSGTVSLELALHNVPSVVTYAMPKLDQLVATKLFKFNLSMSYAQPNILAKKKIFAELIGPNFTLSHLEEEVTRLLDPNIYLKCQQDCQELKSILGNLDTPKEAANQILQLMQ